jgi:hypothetical protein
MRAIKTKIIFASLISLMAIVLGLVSGCATDGKISAIFFPKERAAKAADNVIDEIFGSPPAVVQPNTPTAKPESNKK